ncbi:DUF364 domain-containing protein [Halobacteria archaeon AArc-dxtr1]|nr:DUF364 domain-containing protein [Halobacteria archaeon AArc-dxtr1]
MSDRIIAEVAATLRRRIDVESAEIDRVTVGDGAIMVELDGVEVRETAGQNGEARSTAALAYRPSGTPPEIPTGAGAVLGWLDANWRPPSDADSRVAVAIAIATANALSAPLLDWRRGDPMELLDDDVGTIATVGLFGPAFRKFGDVSVRVIERRPDPDAVPETPSDVGVSLFEPGEAASAIDGADVVFVTGSALLYGGIDHYLELATDEQVVVLIGATASFVPEPAFDAGVDVLAGASIAATESVRRAVTSGACGTSLHDAGVEKGFLVRNDAEGEDPVAVGGSGDPLKALGTERTDNREHPEGDS